LQKGRSKESPQLTKDEQRALSVARENKWSGPYQLLSLAQALNVSVDDLVGTNGSKKRGTGPTGKMKQLFEGRD